MNFKNRKKINEVVNYAILFFFAAIVIFPLYWLATLSLKSPLAAMYGDPSFLPGIDYTPTVESWELMFTTRGNVLKKVVLNSVIISLSSASITLLLGCLAGYGLTRFSYRLGPLKNRDISFWLITGRIIPPIIVAIPFLIMFKTLKLLDTRIGLIIAYTGFNIPLAVWIMQNFFLALPIEVEESALLDGANWFQVFWKIVLPLSIPGLVAAFMICLIFTWNGFLLPLILTFDTAVPLPVFIASQVTQRGQEWGPISVASLIAMSPLILIAIFLGKYVTSMVTGAFR